MNFQAKTIDKKKIQKILLIQLGDIGDLVLTLPTIYALKQIFPEASLAVAVREKAAALVYDCPEVDYVISVDKFKGGAKGILYQIKLILSLIRHGFDLAVELRTGTRGAVLSFLSRASYRVGRFDNEAGIRNRIFTHLVDPIDEENQHSIDHNLNILSPLSPVPVNSNPCIHISQRVKTAVLRMLEREGLKDKKFIVLHPFSIWHYKELPSWHYVKLIHHLSEAWKYPLVITGSKEEYNQAQQLIAASGKQVINMAGKTSIIEMAGILQQALLVVSIDTSAIHIASAVKTPTISIFGPSSTVNWAPRGKQHLAVKNDIKCVPCRRKGCLDSEKSKCLLTLDTRVTIAAIDNHIKKFV